MRSNGDLYFTDPPYGLEGGMDDPEKELDFQGVYLLTAAGKLHLMTREMSRPNGIGLSPDERTLYVANSDPERALWMAFDVPTTVPYPRVECFKTSLRRFNRAKKGSRMEWPLTPMDGSTRLVQAACSSSHPTEHILLRLTHNMRRATAPLAATAHNCILRLTSICCVFR